MAERLALSVLWIGAMALAKNADTPVVISWSAPDFGLAPFAVKGLGTSCAKAAETTKNNTTTAANRLIASP